VVVYSPEHDELRINARTKGERELYRAQFGKFLRGSEDYFSQSKLLTLEPLRTDRRDALDTSGVEGITGVVLREVEVIKDQEVEHRITCIAEDVFAAMEKHSNYPQVLSPDTRLVRAVFEIQFASQKRPRRVEVRTGNVLKMTRHSDTRLVLQWLSARGFRSAAQKGDSDVQVVVCA
jgi:hypothetical protein